MSRNAPATPAKVATPSAPLAAPTTSPTLRRTLPTAVLPPSVTTASPLARSLPAFVVNAPAPTPARPVSANPSTPVMTWRDASAYMKNGHPVIDTERRDAEGHVPTHRLDQPTNRLPNETWQQYEDRVIGRTSFSPDTAARSDLRSLQSDVAQGAHALLTAARAAGVTLGVGETRRTQERQEMLFQKGRKGGAGSVATWTLTSDHTPGRALDLTGDPHALQWLQQNAPKFGFSVMGSMDPGHISMP